MEILAFALTLTTLIALACVCWVCGYRSGRRRGGSVALAEMVDKFRRADDEDDELDNPSRLLSLSSRPGSGNASVTQVFQPARHSMYLHIFHTCRPHTAASLRHDLELLTAIVHPSGGPHASCGARPRARCRGVPAFLTSFTSFRQELGYSRSWA